MLLVLLLHFEGEEWTATRKHGQCGSMNVGDSCVLKCWARWLAYVCCGSWRFSGRYENELTGELLMSVVGLIASEDGEGM